MDLRFSDDERAFRDTVRRFIRDSYPPHLAGRVGPHFSKDEYLEWHRILARKGWVAPSWPTRYGGPGWTPVERYIFADELARHDTIPVLPFGINMVGPVLIEFGTEEQKARFLPPTLAGDIWWCQGYSEPGAGSDLASLATRAVRDGESYIVNGQKCWTTLAQHADWGFFLVRTDPTAKAQNGISFLLIDMKSPGVTVRPIVTIDGAHEVNEVWLEDVRVPVENRVFHENQGWSCAKFLLSHERAGIARIARSKRGIERLRIEAATSPPSDDPWFALRLAELEIELTILEHTELRVLAAEHSGTAPGPEASLLKIKGSEIQQRITELALEIAGEPALMRDAASPDASESDRYFNMRKVSIYGGSNEIQRNIIAKTVLGL